MTDILGLADQYIEKAIEKYPTLEGSTHLLLALIDACSDLLDKRSVTRPGETPEDAAGEAQSPGGPTILDGPLSPEGEGVSQAADVAMRGSEPVSMVTCPSCEQPTELYPNKRYRILCMNQLNPIDICGYKEIA